jgi:hypothetical protein
MTKGVSHIAGHLGVITEAPFAMVLLAVFMTG